jgi:hypothetical protein
MGKEKIPPQAHAQATANMIQWAVLMARVKEQLVEQPHAQLLQDALHRASDLIECSVLPPARKHA